MDETLGKRIVSNRKRLGITQDRLAEQLGVTAQAVSKWENDQSCPDIAMLPKLAEIFGITTDELLGISQPRQETVHKAEIVDDDADESDDHTGHNWEVTWDAGRNTSIFMALWVLLVGALLLTANLLQWDVGFWDILWPSALLMFGLSELYPKFSFVHLGCTLFGAYFLLDNLQLLPFQLSKQILLPVFLLLFGVSLLVEALGKPKKGKFRVSHNGKNFRRTQNKCSTEGETFDSTLSFGEGTHYIDLPRLRSGSTDVSFGELTLDLTVCHEFAPDCHIDANCSFGELEILVPRQYRVEVNRSSSFGSVDIEGHHADEPVGTIYLDANVSFGEISVRYT